MKTIDTRGQRSYSQLIPAMLAFCEAKPNEELEIVMNELSSFNDLKEFLAEREIGFREIYNGEEMAVQFIKTSPKQD